MFTQKDFYVIFMSHSSILFIIPWASRGVISILSIIIFILSMVYTDPRSVNPLCVIVCLVMWLYLGGNPSSWDLYLKHIISIWFSNKLSRPYFSCCIYCLTLPQRKLLIAGVSNYFKVGECIALCASLFSHILDLVMHWIIILIIFVEPYYNYWDYNSWYDRHGSTPSENYPSLALVCFSFATFKKLT